MTTFHEDDAGITLTLNRDQFDLLLLTLGFAVMAVREHPGSASLSWTITKLANLLNEGNPSFTPYEIPEEFQ
jgi:hypothetical protein